MSVFCVALKDDYRQLAEEIQEMLKEESMESDLAESDAASTVPVIPTNKSGQSQGNRERRVAKT